MLSVIESAILNDFFSNKPSDNESQEFGCDFLDEAANLAMDLLNIKNYN